MVNTDSLKQMRRFAFFLCLFSCFYTPVNRFKLMKQGKVDISLRRECVLVSPWLFACLVAVRLSARLSRSIHFGEVAT